MTTDRAEQAIRLADRAEAMLEAGLVASAAELIQEALKINPDLPHGRLLEARVELTRHQPRHALRALSAERLIDADQPPTPEAMLLQARALAQAGRLPLATQSAQRFVVRFPDDVRGHRLLAGLLITQDMTEPAIESLRQVRRLDPADRGVTRILSELLEPTDPNEAAELLMADYSRAHSIEVLLRLARLYRDNARYRDADEAMRTVLTRSPRDAALWIEAGELAIVNGDHETARTRLEQAVALDDSRASRIALAQLDLQGGRFARAGHGLWRLVRDGVSDCEVVCGLMVACIAAGRLGLAEKINHQFGHGISRAERRTTSAQWWTHAALGQATQHAAAPLNQAQQVDSPLRSMLKHATTALAQQAKAHPERADAHYHHANCLRAAGQQDEASASLEQAIKINPRYRDALALQHRLEIAGSDGMDQAA